MTTPSDTNKTDNTEIDEILDDLPNAWCDDCEHPRCAGKKKATKAALETIITQRCKESYKKGYIAAGIDGLKNE